MLLPTHEAIFQYALNDKIVGAFGSANNILKTCKMQKKSRYRLNWIESKFTFGS